MNWWARDKPASFGDVTKLMVCSPDRSNVPSKQADIDRDLPTRKPYWLEPGCRSNEKPEDGIRATWIGHATVVAEVDSVVFITDPMFSQRASPSQLFGPKRYTQPGTQAWKIDD